MVLSVRYLLCEHKDLSSDPPRTFVKFKHVKDLCNPGTGGVETGGAPELAEPVSLTNK